MTNLYTLSSATETSFKAKTPKLMPFQNVGVEYLSIAKRSLLADEMGLGKSVQSIAFMNEIDIDKYLVICPASLCDNWEREILKWSFSKYEPHIFKSRKKTPRNCVLILSYGVCINFDTLALILKNYNFGGLIVDECQFLKNMEARRSALLYAKNGPFDRAEYIAALSGTPLLNRPTEIFPIASRLNQELFPHTPTIERFGEHYCKTSCNPFSGKKEYKEAKDPTNLNFLLRNNIMCRRLKKHVLKDLPPKIIRTIYLESSYRNRKLLDQERTLYDTFLNAGGLSQTEHATLFQVRNVLGLLKVKAIADYAKMILMEQEKILIFGWHREVLARISASLSQYYPVILTGVPTVNERQARIDRFNQRKECRVFIGSITAAGIGLNLQIASHVIFAEMSWVPADNEQAMDRAHRIGQKNSVIADYLIHKNSVDEHILKTVNKKSKIIGNILDQS